MSARTITTGFTLIELSVVLVVIGLLVGGVLVGRDLINAAAIRAQISQIEEYNTAANTFKLKYGGLPGDLLRTEAAAFGLFGFPASSSTGLGDGNGAITTDNVQGDPFCRNEVLVFWRHLAEAKLIKGNYSMVSGTNAGNISIWGIVAVIPTSHEMMNAHFPEARIGRNASVIAGAKWYAGKAGTPNYFAISGLNGMTSVDGHLSGSTNPFTGAEAYSIDLKLDDGAPNSGRVRASDATANLDPRPGIITAPRTGCVTANEYVKNSYTQDCSLQIQFQ